MPVLQKMFCRAQMRSRIIVHLGIYKQWAWKLNTRHLCLYGSRTKCEHMWGDASLQMLNIHHWATCGWEFIALQPKTVPSRNELLSSQTTFNTKKKKKKNHMKFLELSSHPLFFSNRPLWESSNKWGLRRLTPEWTIESLCGWQCVSSLCYSALEQCRR